MTRTELIDRLAVFQTHVDPCEHGHVDHGPEAHQGPRVVHTFVGSLGADWDYESAVDFITSAKRIAKDVWMGHVRVDSGERIVAFEVRR